MPTDLERFRDHCRKMAESTPQTKVRTEDASRPGAVREVKVGTISEGDRALWRMLASEVDRYMDGDDEVVSVAPDTVDVELF